MMKNLKEMLPSIIIALIVIAMLALTVWLLTMPIDAETEAWSPPSTGAGRVVREGSRDAVFTAGASIDTHDAETGENRARIASDELVEVIPEADPIIETDVDALIVEVAGEYGLPWEFVRAVCWVESGLDPSAISVTGDYGLMQVSYINHGTYGLDNPLDPRANLRAGCAILKDALDFCDGDFTRALMCYNRGRAYALAQWRDGIFSTAYTNKVLERYYAYERGEY